MKKQLFRKKPIGEVVSEGGDESFNPDQGGEDPNLIHLERTLTVRDLTAFGIAAVVGAGIFSAIGNAAYNGGPAVSLLYVFVAIACAFSALCYAEFAARVPVAGSAYTYAYVSFGELFAWIIGWDLILEYAIGNIAVAISWSDYFTRLANGFLKNFGAKIPEYISMDFLTAMRGHKEALSQLQSGIALDKLPDNILEAYNAWEMAPRLGPIPFIADLPALAIVVLITMLIYIGIRESRNASNIMVGIKLFTILMVIVVGVFYIDPANWTPFAPNGFAGVMSGVSAVFFAYIGFDAISTTAEECKDPQRDLPKGIIYTLIITTILYVTLSLILTGMVSYKELAVGDPMAFIFAKVGLNFFSYIISFSAIIAITSILLVYQMGQPRIWMSMSRDGLLPKAFSRLHPKYHTPGFATIITGVLVGIPTLFMNLTEVTDLTSIGTLFAFVLVCGGVLVLEKDPNPQEGRFKVPYVNGKFLIPALFVATIVLVNIFAPEAWGSFFSMADPQNPDLGGWEVFKHKIPMVCFIIVFIAITILSYLKNLSLIPVLGVISCLYLMTELGVTNWLRFVIWLVIGMVIYVTYGFKNSKLNKTT
jgi:APA family basic amino acid/polyamine antiporter